MGQAAAPTEPGLAEPAPSVPLAPLPELRRTEAPHLLPDGGLEATLAWGDRGDRGQGVTLRKPNRDPRVTATVQAGLSLDLEQIATAAGGGVPLLDTFRARVEEAVRLQAEAMVNRPLALDGPTCWDVAEGRPVLIRLTPKGRGEALTDLQGVLLSRALRSTPLDQWRLKVGAAVREGKVGAEQGARLRDLPDQAMRIGADPDPITVKRLASPADIQALLDAGIIRAPLTKSGTPMVDVAMDPDRATERQAINLLKYLDYVRILAAKGELKVGRALDAALAKRTPTVEDLMAVSIKQAVAIFDRIPAGVREALDHYAKTQPLMVEVGTSVDRLVMALDDPKRDSALVGRRMGDCVELHVPLTMANAFAHYSHAACVNGLQIDLMERWLDQALEVIGSGPSFGVPLHIVNAKRSSTALHFRLEVVPLHLRRTP
jgi:hypothetical protein